MNSRHDATPTDGTDAEWARMEELAREKQEKVIAEAPNSAKKSLREAFSATASPRRAIKTFCLICTGYDRTAIQECSAWTCPLWAYRPFQEHREQEDGQRSPGLSQEVEH